MGDGADGDANSNSVGDGINGDGNSNSVGDGAYEDASNNNAGDGNANNAKDGNANDIGDNIGGGNTPDFVAINSCAVTAESERKSRQAARRMRKRYPHAVVALTGCFPQRSSESALSIPGIDIVAGVGEADRVAREAAAMMAMAKKRAAPDTRKTAGALDTRRTAGTLVTRGGAISGASANSIADASATGIADPVANDLADARANGRASAGESIEAAAFNERLAAEERPHSEERPHWAGHAQKGSRAPNSTDARSFEERSRALLKIQDGCDNRCSYCVVPYLRGRSRSVDWRETLKEAEALARGGAKEITLTGIHISSYGKDMHAADHSTSSLARSRLAQNDPCHAPAAQAIACALAAAPTPGASLLGPLVESIAATVKAHGARLRLSSLEPGDVTPQLVDSLARVGEPALCPHFHLSLQSGSGATLERMRRRYSPESFLEAVASLRRAFPGAAFTTDVIVGFPGETDAEFAETVELCKTVAFSRIHVFRYSPRPGTPASGFPNQVPPPVKADRSAALARLADELAERFNQGFVGKTVDMLVERLFYAGEHPRGHACIAVDDSSAGESPPSDSAIATGESRLSNSAIATGESPLSDSSIAACNAGDSARRCGSAQHKLWLEGTTQHYVKAFSRAPLGARAILRSGICQATIATADAACLIGWQTPIESQ